MSAIISADGRHRYRLERVVDAACPLVVAGIMVNPSTAGPEINDATVRRWLGFTERWGYGKCIIGNKFAFRDKNVKNLAALSMEDAVGPDNDKHIEQILRDADFHVVAWGPLAKLPPRMRKRWQDIVRIADRVGCELYCLGTADDGHPRHPLYIPNDKVPETWIVPWFANRAPVQARANTFPQHIDRYGIGHYDEPQETSTSAPEQARHNIGTQSSR